MKLLLALLALVAAVVASGALSPVAAAEPTLGATFGPLTLVYEQEQEVSLRNRSTLPVRAVLSVDGEGWTLAETEFTMQPDTEAVVPVLTAGDDPATIRATLTPRDKLPGVETASLVVELTARHASPFDNLPILPLLVLLAGLLLTGSVLFRVGRRVRNRRASRARVNARLARFVAAS